MLNTIADRIKIWGVQLVIFALSGALAFLLRFDFSIPPEQVVNFRTGILVWIVTKAIAFRVVGLDRGWWRYVSLPDIGRIGAGNLLGSVAALGLILLIQPVGFPRSLYPLDFLICLGATAGIRIATRMVYEAGTKARNNLDKRVLIYGAGTAGQSLVREIRSNAELQYTVCGFVDDDRTKHGAILNGVKVLGIGDDIGSLAARHNALEILIACPAATGAQMTNIIRQCQAAGVACKTIPGVAELIGQKGLLAQIRDVAVEDLLGRNPVRLDDTKLRSRLEGQVVAVTGAAGSIGSELCRQIARFHPKAIVAFEIGETALFYLDREMRASFPDVRFHNEIGNVQDERRLREVFELHRPSVVYHAAAYKHVPVMESHLFQAVENNVGGTWNVARTAERCGVAHLILISTDKAVKPVNVMGLSKRVAEIVINSMPRGRTQKLSVRFGNVLGSNGSVIPLFKEQIAKGGPVTVTHPDMQRYFMTIPEAAQLVLQASTMGRGSEIFVLDMGQPVRIMDLATNLILLSGLQPEKDIKIEYSGIRPGEKLYEELSAYEEGTVATDHEKIKVFAGVGRPWEEVEARLIGIREGCEDRDFRKVMKLLRELTPEYIPSGFILEQLRACEEQGGRMTTAADMAAAELREAPLAYGQSG